MNKPYISPTDLLSKLLRLGLHIGHTMKVTPHDNYNYVAGSRYDHAFINLMKNFELFNRLNQMFVHTKQYRDVAKYPYRVAYISTDPVVAGYIIELGDQFQIDYCVGHWRPGTYSNIKRTWDSDKYISEQYLRLRGIPDIVILLNRDGDGSEDIIYEISGYDCWIFGIADTNLRPHVLTFPIMSNDDSIYIILFWAMFLTDFLITHNMMHYNNRTGIYMPKAWQLYNKLTVARQKQCNHVKIKVARKTTIKLEDNLVDYSDMLLDGL